MKIILIITAADVLELQLPRHEKNPVEVENPPDFGSSKATFGVLGGIFVRRSRRLQNFDPILEYKPPQKKKKISKAGGAGGFGQP